MAHSRGVLVLVLLVLPATAGCLGEDPLLVAVSAPKAASGMTLFLVTERSFIERMQESTNRAEYAIYFGDALVYPPGGKGASFQLDGRSGSAFIPYDTFVVGNGEYDVLVDYAGTQTRARATVEKWVEYVFLHPFEKGDTILVQAALGSATGGRPEDRVLAKGELVLDIHYHGEDGASDRAIGSVATQTRHDQVSTSVHVPRARLDAGPGWYSFEPVFHNLEARNNVQVLADPTMGNFDPPWNWIKIS